MAVDLLKKCPLFAGLTDEGLQKVRGIAVFKRSKKKEILFAEGEEAKGFYVVLRGRVKVYKISPEGKEQILHVVQAPDSFAEAALFQEGTYPAFAESMEECQLLFIPKRDFLQMIQENPQLSINMIVSLSQYLRRFASLIEELSLKEVSSRLAKYLLDLSVKGMREGKAPNEVELDLTKTQLALKLGTISETLSRTFSKLKAKGVIGVEKNRIRILKRDVLEEISSGLRVY
ncbi:MAG: Crp/Fnr family transcriptional regulator [Desulfobacterota bacterium]|nr:Crp/Fnr family transcriptional regulator [Thermodesulfobacteriota bacterium]